VSYLFNLLPFYKKNRIHYDKIYSEFFKDSIKDKIISVDYNDHAIYIKIKNGTEYLCDPVISKGYDSKIYFEKIVDVGDSLMKNEGQMNFILKKNNGTKYKFDVTDRTKYSNFYKRPAK
jgi:hypothetical protein